MSEHSCRTLTPGCFRCELGRDEMEAERLDHVRVAKLLSKVAANKRRRPGTRGLLLDLADQIAERADEIALSLGRPAHTWPKDRAVLRGEAG